MGGDIFRTVAAVSTLGLSEMAYYGPKDQRKAQTQASDAQRNAEMEARRIAASGKPMEESATLGMNTGGSDSALGALGLIVNPDLAKRKKPVVGLGTASTGAGLGSAVTGSLGFGG